MIVSKSLPTVSCFTNLSIGLYHVVGKQVAASAAFIACIYGTGDRIAIFKINDVGKKQELFPLIYAREKVNDIDFSPYDSRLLVSASKDKMVKLWKIPEIGIAESTSNTYHSFRCNNHVGLAKFHPVLSNILSSAAHNNILLFDLDSQKLSFENSEHTDTVQSIYWCESGDKLVTSSKDTRIRIFDTRCSKAIVQSANSHENIRDSAVIWLKNENFVLSSGFTKDSCREVYLRDIRKFDHPIKSFISEQASGILIPLYDNTSNSLFLGKRGDNTILTMDISKNDLAIISQYRGAQMKDICLAPKSLLEANETHKIFQTTSNSIIPVSYVVPFGSDWKTSQPCNRIDHAMKPKNLYKSHDEFVEDNLTQNEYSSELNMDISESNKTINSQYREAHIEDVRIGAKAFLGPHEAHTVSKATNNTITMDSHESPCIFDSKASQPNIDIDHVTEAIDLNNSIGIFFDDNQAQIGSMDQVLYSYNGRLRERTSMSSDNIEQEHGHFFACSHCTNRLATSSSLKRHRLKMHSEILNIAKTEFVCPFCEKIFAHKDNYYQHINIHSKRPKKKKKSKKQKLSCNYCQQKFTRKTSILTHFLKRRCKNIY